MKISNMLRCTIRVSEKCPRPVPQEIVLRRSVNDETSGQTQTRKSVKIKSAELIKATDGLILYYPLENGLFPPIVKSWFERVFIPGVSFTFTKGGRVKGALKNLRCIHFLVLAEPNAKITKRSDPSKSLLRAIRMNAGLRCQTSLSVVNDLNALGIAARNNLERAKSC